MESIARCCTSAGNYPSGRRGTAQLKRSASPSGGRSVTHSPSVRTTLPSSGSTA
ncbi:hypothetical protein ANANG_G00307850 [Anguilla anguilla]|uniref:Uncharacterized protein n=1 Tax=Anguilla anguilla TaxID=7936 RepID=A0A9D3LL74_ANGAN|nr:hypothetical protein ANANG_G00307850 [Anguilla anguilla]